MIGNQDRGRLLGAEDIQLKPADFVDLSLGTDEESRKFELFVNKYLMFFIKYYMLFINSKKIKVQVDSPQGIT